MECLLSLYKRYLISITTPSSSKKYKSNYIIKIDSILSCFSLEAEVEENTRKENTTKIYGRKF